MGSFEPLLNLVTRSKGELIVKPTRTWVGFCFILQRHDDGRVIMNIKVGSAFLSGFLLAVLIIAVISIVTPKVRANGSKSTLDFMSTINETYITELVGPLNAVALEIQDQDISEFYDKLISQYDLQEVSANVTQVASSNLQDVLPDIARIQYTAISLPLLEAGKRIQDKDIAEFYSKFLKDTGWVELAPVAGTK
jgi:hypothetical protein